MTRVPRSTLQFGQFPVSPVTMQGDARALVAVGG